MVEHFVEGFIQSIDDHICRGYLNFYVCSDIEEAFPNLHIERLNDFAQYISLNFDEEKVDEQTGVRYNGITVLVCPLDVGNRSVDHVGRLPFVPEIISGILTLDGVRQEQILYQWRNTIEMIEDIDELV